MHDLHRKYRYWTNFLFIDEFHFCLNTAASFFHLILTFRELQQGIVHGLVEHNREALSYPINHLKLYKNAKLKNSIKIQSDLAVEVKFIYWGIRLIIKARVLRISKFVNTVHKHGVHDDESAVNSSRILRSPAQIS